MNNDELIAKYPILKFFDFDHLPSHLQVKSRPFAILAIDVAKDPENKNPAEIATALRKLLEAKDCAVRAIL